MENDSIEGLPRNSGKAYEQDRNQLDTDGSTSS